MSIGHLITPIDGSCIGDGWFRGTGPCPEVLKISGTYTHLSGSPCSFLATNFASRGKTGFACGGSDAYVADQSDGSQHIDVWRAYRDGIWTSSVDILVYYTGKNALFMSGVINAEPLSYPSARVTKNPAVINGTAECSAPSWSCPTALSATITVNDDGSISIA